MDREVMLTGIGGQGVQFCAQALAHALVRESREVQLFGVYEGMMRGGRTEASLVFADRKLLTPPLLSRTWSAIVMHPAHWKRVEDKLHADSWVLCNSSLVARNTLPSQTRVFEIPATQLANELGAPMSASLLLIAAYVGLTELVSVDALVEGMRDSLPAYRRDKAADNEKALRLGVEAVVRGAVPAWRSRSGVA